MSTHANVRAPQSSNKMLHSISSGSLTPSAAGNITIWNTTFDHWHDRQAAEDHQGNTKPSGSLPSDASPDTQSQSSTSPSPSTICTDSQCSCHADDDRESGMSHACTESSERFRFRYVAPPEWQHHARWGQTESLGYESEGSAYTEVRKKVCRSFNARNDVEFRVNAWKHAQKAMKYEELEQWSLDSDVGKRPRYERSIQEPLDVRGLCDDFCRCQWDDDFLKCIKVGLTRSPLEKTKKKFYDGINGMYNFRRFHCRHNPAPSRKWTMATYEYYDQMLICHRERYPAIDEWARSTKNLPRAEIWRGRLGRMKFKMEMKRASIRDAFTRGDYPYGLSSI